MRKHQDPGISCTGSATVAAAEGCVLCDGALQAGASVRVLIALLCSVLGAASSQQICALGSQDVPERFLGSNAMAKKRLLR